MQMPYAMSHSPEAAGELTTRKLVSIIHRRRLLIIMAIAIALTAAAIASFLQEPVYVAEVSLLVNTRPPSGAVGEAVPAVAEALAFVPRTIETHQQLLENPVLADAAAQELGLPPPGPRGVRGEIVPLSDFLTLRVESGNPEHAAALANKIAELYVRDTQERGRRAAGDSAEYLRGMVEQAHRTLTEAENALRDYKTANRIADVPTELASYTEMINTLAGAVATAQAEASAAQRSADQYRGALSKEQQVTVSSSTIARNPVVAQLESELTTLELQRAAQAATRGAGHPEVQRTDATIREARQRLAEAVSTVIESETRGLNPLYVSLATNLATAEASALAARARSQALGALAADHEQRLAAMPTIQTEVARLERESLLASQEYTTLLQRYNNLRLQEALVQPSVQIVTPAEPPTSPERPNLASNLAVGLLLGILLAAMLVGIAETVATEDRIRSPWDAQSELGLPVLATVPRASTGSPLLTVEGHCFEVANAFRQLRTSLRLSSQNGAPKVLLVAGPGRSEGRSTVALNLGVALANSGKRTLLIDSDFRRPTLHFALGTTDRLGLSDVLTRGADPVALISATGVTNLCLLPAGPPPANPATALASDGMRDMLRMLEPMYDVIVLDSPPTSLARDALALAPMCTAVLAVLRIGATPLKAARQSIARLQASGGRLVGLVFNQAVHAAPPGEQATPHKAV